VLGDRRHAGVGEGDFHRGFCVARRELRRGLQRGELPEQASPTLIGDLLVGAILVHVMATPVHLTDTVRRRSAEYLDVLVDTILAGVATVPASS